MKYSSLNLPVAITVGLCLLLTPLSSTASGAKQGEKVYGEVRPDAALIYYCGRVSLLYDDQFFINMSINHYRCTFTHLFPGTHVLWDRYGRSWLFDFAPGQTYYLGDSDKASKGADTRLRLFVLSEAEGQAEITKAKQFVEPTRQERSKAASTIAKKWPLIKEKLESKIALTGGEIPYVPPASTDNIIKIPMGTVLTVELMENLNSGLNKAGDDVWFRTTEDVRVNDNLFVRAGTPVKALVRETEETSHFRSPGWLDVTIVSAPAADGTLCPLIGQVSAIGSYYITKGERALAIASLATLGPGAIAVGAVAGALTKGMVSLVPSGELFRAFTKRDIWIKPIQATGEKNPVTRNSDQVVKAHSPGKIIFKVGKGEVPETVQIIFEDSGEIVSAELIEVAGNQIPRPIRATSLTRAKEGWIAQYGGWDLCRFLRLGDAGTQLAFRLTATDGTVVIAQGVVSMTLK